MVRYAAPPRRKTAKYATPPRQDELTMRSCRRPPSTRRSSARDEVRRAFDAVMEIWVRIRRRSGDPPRFHFPKPALPARRRGLNGGSTESPSASVPKTAAPPFRCSSARRRRRAMSYEHLRTSSSRFPRGHETTASSSRGVHLLAQHPLVRDRLVAELSTALAPPATVAALRDFRTPTLCQGGDPPHPPAYLLGRGPSRSARRGSKPAGSTITEPWVLHRTPLVREPRGLPERFGSTVSRPGCRASSISRSAAGRESASATASRRWKPP